MLKTIQMDALDNGGLYARTVDPEGDDSLSRIARRIAPGSTVLDLGAGPGALGAYLSAERGCILDGVDCDPEASRMAAPFYRTFRVADLESANLRDLFPGANYDYVVCADLLEHLQAPWSLAAQLPTLLAPGGKIVLSMPNVAYAGLIAELLSGQFRYRPVGLLDRTHLRFFTRHSLLEFLSDSELAPTDLEFVFVDPEKSEFQICFQALPASVQKQLLAVPDALVYQFIVEAAPGAGQARSDHSFATAEVSGWPFVCQLFWRTTEGDFQESSSICVTAAMIRERRTIRLEFPPINDLGGLRLDLADRPGFAFLHGLRLLDRKGMILWAPTAEQILTWPGHRMSMAWNEPGSLAVHLGGADPMLPLPLPEDVLLRARQGGSVEVDLSWPPSAEELRLSKKLEEMEKTAEAQAKHLADSEAGNARAADRIEDLERALLQKEGALTASREEVDRLHQDLTGVADRFSLLNKEIVNGRRRTLALETDLEQRGRQIRELEDSRTVLTRRLAEAERFSSALQHTLSWRITAPLRRLRSLVSRTGRLLRRRRHIMIPAPVCHLEPCAEGAFRSTGNDPQFYLHSNLGRLPAGWCRLSIRGDEGSVPLLPTLFFDTGSGFREEETIRLPPVSGRSVECLVRLPDRVEALRLDPMEVPGDFSLQEIRIEEVSGVCVCLRHLMLDGRLKDRVSKGWRIFQQEGLTGLRQATRRRIDGLAAEGGRDYQWWIATYEQLQQNDRRAIGRHIESFHCRPLISIVMPTYNTAEKWLRLAIESVRRQIYPHWELCIADDASSQEQVKRTLEEYQALDARIRVCIRPENGHISAASNTALEMVRGEFVALLDHDDELPETALYFIAAELQRYPEAELLYSDEDKIDERGRRFDPYFKSDWNPDLFYSHNMISHLGVYRTDLLRQLGGFRAGYEGSQDYDLALRCIERIVPDKIRHIPRVLYHWRAIQGSTALNPEQKDYAERAARKAIQSHFDRIGSPARIEPGPSGGLHRARYPLPPEPPLVSLIIPTRDGYQVLSTCLRGLRQATRYPKMEVLVADNGSTCPATRELLAEVGEYGRVIRCDFEFNFSRINNLAAAEASGELLCFLNNDIEIVDPGWLEEMASHALRPEVGAVGAKLYYPDGRIQHAGIVLGLGQDKIAGTPHQGLAREQFGYFGKAALLQNFSAVTAACILMRKELFAAIDGFDEELSVAYNDVDLCLRIRQAGYRILWTPHAELLHHESATRGYESTPEKKARLQREADYMHRKWGTLLASDPFYNPSLALDRSDFTLAYPPRWSRPWEGGADRAGEPQAIGSSGSKG